MQGFSRKLSLGTEIGLPSRSVIIVILKPELLYYFMSVQVSLEKVGFSLIAILASKCSFARVCKH